LGLEPPDWNKVSLSPDKSAEDQGNL